MKLSPPDISGCTRIEVTYTRSISGHFFGGDERPPVLSLTEWKYVRSLGETLSITDLRIIKALADELREGVPVSPSPTEGVTFAHFIKFVCYQDSEVLAKFTAMLDKVFDEQGHWFKYESLASTYFVPPQIENLVTRTRCAESLSHLYLQLWMYCGYTTQNVRLPCDKWCDTLLEQSKEDRDDVMKDLRCHGVDGTKCHYAMNINWAPDAPPDMVFLFEANGGWNQCGGPELFSFNNHIPRGGCVLLNDGSMETGKEPTILFIRTGEELKQLRWK